MTPPTRTTSPSNRVPCSPCTGVAISPENARHLVATLIADGGLDALSAAAMIQKGVERDLFAVALEPAERDAILSVMEDPPDGLVELRGVFARDHADRTQGLSGRLYPPSHDLRTFVASVERDRERGVVGCSLGSGTSRSRWS
jgi:hypothetical protein